MHRSRNFGFSTLFALTLCIAGCQQPAPPPAQEGLPADPNVVDQKVANMKMVASGVNKPLIYKAPAFGDLYLYDQTTGLDIYQGPIAKGEEFLFAPGSSRAQINKETIDLIRDTNEKDTYELYFLPK